MVIQTGENDVLLQVCSVCSVSSFADDFFDFQVKKKKKERRKKMFTEHLSNIIVRGGNN